MTMALVVSSPVFIDRKDLIVFVVDMQVVLTARMRRVLYYRVWTTQMFPSMSSFFDPVLLSISERIEVDRIFSDSQFIIHTSLLL